MLMLMVKPLPRWQYVVGRWLGIVGLNAILLVITGGGIYGTVRYLAQLDPLNADDEARLRQEVLVARFAQEFDPPDFRDSARAVFERNLEEGVYSNVEGLDREKEIERLVEQMNHRWRVVPLGEDREFVFRNVRCERGGEQRPLFDLNVDSQLRQQFDRVKERPLLLDRVPEIEPLLEQVCRSRLPFGSAALAAV